MALNFWVSCLHLPAARIVSMCVSCLFTDAEEWIPEHRAFNQLRHIPSSKFPLYKLFISALLLVTETRFIQSGTIGRSCMPYMSDGRAHEQPLLHHSVGSRSIRASSHPPLLLSSAVHDPRTSQSPSGSRRLSAVGFLLMHLYDSTPKLGWRFWNCRYWKDTLL